MAASPEVRARIERSLETNRIKTAEDYMKEIPRDIERDVYGEGGVVGELEGEVAKMLGKPVAVFLPTPPRAAWEGCRRALAAAHHQ